MDRDSSVSIATAYGLDGPGIESRWEARFSAPVQTGPRAHPASYTIGTGLLWGGIRPGRGVDRPRISSAQVHESVELYISSPSALTWQVTEQTFTFLVTGKICCYFYHGWVRTLVITVVEP